MDPNACLQRFLGALIDNDASEAYQAHLDLSTWFRNGGFAPHWKPWERGAFEGYVRLDRFTSLGSYPIAYLQHDRCICAACASLMGCKAEDCDVNWEGELECEECGEAIESAYGSAEEVTDERTADDVNDSVE